MYKFLISSKYHNILNNDVNDSKYLDFGKQNYDVIAIYGTFHLDWTAKGVSRVQRVNGFGIKNYFSS